MNDNPQNQQPPIQWPTTHSQDNEKAAEIARHKVDQLYKQQGEPNQVSANPQTAQNNTAKPIDMQQYHSAWQSYYQEYFNRYYNHAYKQAEAKIKQDAAIQKPAPEPEDETNKTVAELKQKLQNHIGERAKKVKKSRHFKPILAAISIGALFMLVNYNQVAFGSIKQYLTPSSTANTPLIIMPDSSTKIGPDPLIIIPKIGVQAPVIYNEPSYDDAKVEKALEKGVVHYGDTAVPGQNDNSVLLGHSSNNVFSPGDYKYVFVNLNRLDEGDAIYMNFQGKRYTYKVTTAHKVVQPDDLSVLKPSKKPILTLITCTPAGTNLRRLIVVAEQVSPDPAQNRAGSNLEESQPKALPATSKSVWGNIF